MEGAKRNDALDEAQDRTEMGMGMAGTAVPHGFVADAVLLTSERQSDEGGRVKVGDGAVVVT